MSKMLEKVMEKKTAKDMIDTMREKEIKNIRNYKVIAGLQELAILLDKTKMLSNEIATLMDELDEKEIKELQNLNMSSPSILGDIFKLTRR